jgi:hypothetical protein
MVREEKCTSKSAPATAEALALAIGRRIKFHA